MPLQTYLPFLVLALLMTIVAMIWSVGQDARDLTFSLAMIFPACAVIVSLAVNRRAWLQSSAEKHSPAPAWQHSRTNAFLMALVYGWGGAAMLGIYSLTSIWWWHSWQYGLGMLGIAVALGAYCFVLNRGESKLRDATFLNATALMSVGQAIAACVGLMFLLASGKIEAGRADWAANIVFVAGGFGIVCLSIIAAGTHWRSSRSRLISLIGA